jgi:polyisoprenoid-binding protein YceI
MIGGCAVIGWLFAGQIAVAKPISFDFKDPKGVNAMSFVLDSLLEPIMGLATGISGTVEFDPEKPEATTGTIVVSTKALHIENQGMEQTLHKSDWLDVEAYPQISFKVKKVADVKREPNKPVEMKITGDFTCHGVTKEITVPVKASYLAGRAQDRSRSKGDLLVLRSNFTIKRKDFNIKADMGDEVVANDIEIRVSIVGTAKEG